MKKILLLEDNESIIKGLKFLLEKEGYEVVVFRDVTAMKKINYNDFDIAILDVMLPDGSGFEVCHNIKNEAKIPVIFLTARDEEDDIVQGFELGADDYIAKPFRNRELLSRVNRLIKGNTKIIECQNVRIDVAGARVYVDGQEVNFTALEYRILLFLFMNMDKLITREAILEKIWDVAGNFVNDNTLTVYIKRIRAKLNNDKLITTVKGLGYRVNSK